MFSYPNILIKQTNDEYSVFLAKKFSSEIASRIDSLKLPDIDFKFNNAWANSTQFQSTFCSQETVAYLITVSLGFETELHVTRIDRKKLSKQVLVTNRKKISKSTYYMTFVSPFDGLLVLRDRNEKRTIPFFSRKTVVVSIASWAKKLEKILLKATKYISSNIDDYGDLFQGDQRLAGEAEKIANILTYGNISAKFSDNTELALELALETLSDSLYATADSNELLMSREDADRTKLNFSERPSLQDLVNTQGSLYGPGTLKVLQEIGWPTRRSPNPVNLKKVVISNPIVNASKQVQMKAELHRFYLLIKCPTVPCEENSSDWNFL